MSKAQYLHPDLEFELDRLRDDILQCQPNLVVALGTVALWALTGHSGIKKIRGTILRSPLVPIKVLATYHPAAIFREWTLRVIVKGDLMKAKREAAFKEFKFPQRQIKICETQTDLGEAAWVAANAKAIAVDIETGRRQITCIGFATDANIVYVIPFTKRSGDGNYWANAEDEVYAWQMVRTILRSPVTKIFQNGLYDIQWLLHYGCEINGRIEDTMIAHHALFPELPKSLDFLGSSYTTEQPWKLFRRRGDDVAEKRND